MALLSSPLMAVDMRLGPTGVDSGAPRGLFDTGIRTNAVQDQYRASPDGSRFLLLKPVENDTQRGSPIEIVLNWAQALRTSTR